MVGTDAVDALSVLWLAVVAPSVGAVVGTEVAPVVGDDEVMGKGRVGIKLLRRPVEVSGKVLAVSVGAVVGIAVVVGRIVGRVGKSEVRAPVSVGTLVGTLIGKLSVVVGRRLVGRMLVKPLVGKPSVVVGRRLVGRIVGRPLVGTRSVVGSVTGSVGINEVAGSDGTVVGTTFEVCASEVGTPVVGGVSRLLTIEETSDTAVVTTGGSIVVRGFDGSRPVLSVEGWVTDGADTESVPVGAIVAGIEGLVTGSVGAVVGIVTPGIDVGNENVVGKVGTGMLVGTDTGMLVGNGMLVGRVGSGALVGKGFVGICVVGSTVGTAGVEAGGSRVLTSDDS